MCGSCRRNNCVVSQRVYEQLVAPKGSSIRSLAEYTFKPKKRLQTAYPTLNRVLGGGFTVPGVVLLGGEPGIGKSTLLIQIADMLSKDALYVVNEEKIEDIRERAERLRLRNMGDIQMVQSSSPQETKHKIIESDREFVIIDSLQGMDPDDENVKPGPLATTDIARDLCHFAKKMFTYEYRRGHPIAMILVCHVNKEADFAGFKKIQHDVDMIAWFRGDPFGSKRVFRSQKSRMGGTNNAATFSMQEDGLHEMVIAEDHEKINGNGGHDDGSIPR